MPILNGCLIIARDVPSFVIPVLVDRPGSNHSLIQNIDGDNHVISFSEIDVGNDHEHSSLKIEINTGDQAVWGFRSLMGDIRFCDFATMKLELHQELQANKFSDFPLIESEIARFCSARSQYIKALLKSYDLMRHRSKLSAAIWRDCSVLLPVAKRELAQAIPKHLSQELEHVRLVGDGHTMLLELPEEVREHVSSLGGKALTDTISLGSTFGFDAYAFRFLSASKPTSSRAPTFDEPYGELAPFTGIGEMATKSGRTYHRIRRLIPPWVSKGSRPSSKWPLVTFCVVNTNLATIDRATKFVRARPSQSVKIAIVTLPITFGVSRGHKLDLRLLDTLRPAFDYIFVIGNHVLQMPTGPAPRLAASSRAATYVKACVDGIMQVVWASGAPTTAAEFFSVFPRDGFGLVGRSHGNRATPTEDLLRRAVQTSLNERLPLHLGQRLVVVGPLSVVDNAHVLSFLDRAAEFTLNETMSVVSTNRRAAATLLGFGVRLVAADERRHREFCLELLHSRGFSILREMEAVVYGEFAQGGLIAIGLASSERALDHAADMVRRNLSAKKRFVLTNFATSTSAVEHYWRSRIAVFHYSLLDTFIEGRMSSPPRPRWK
ncbi:hypothetical protein [Bradyrhizobium nitroreducens]|uniref:hypothetical protein n=1 Tax=Bradyrhizobium nitroreducens TaxID=709803 RepID=UPI0011AEAA4E|nr:hypothetical protein [Bradyrhizobium nitroreducens]